MRDQQPASAFPEAVCFLSSEELKAADPPLPGNNLAHTAWCTAKAIVAAGNAGTEVQHAEHSSASSIVGGMQGRWGMSQGARASTSAKLTGPVQL